MMIGAGGIVKVGERERSLIDEIASKIRVICHFSDEI